MKNFSELPQGLQSYINRRFGEYHINGKNAYESIIPDEVKSMSIENIEKWFKAKDISHKLPRSKFPEYESDIGNVYMEDRAVNRARSNDIASESDADTAWVDGIADTIDGDINEDGIIDLMDEIDNSSGSLDSLDILVGAFPFAMILTGRGVIKKINNDEIKLEESPRYFAYSAGGRTVKCAMIGVAVTSGQPIIVACGVGYVLYKSKRLIKKVFSGAYYVATHKYTKTAGIFSVGLVVVAISGLSNLFKSIFLSKKK